jgi:ABC-type lipoprotein export system ATPase subunit
MISISNLSYSYSPSAKIHFPDFSIPRGEHFLLLGESGSGKTTLLHLIGGLLRNYEGSITLENTELANLSESALDKFRGQKIGFIFQRNHLVSALSVEKNLMMAPFLADLPIDRNRIKEILTHLGLENRSTSKVTELSQGQMQRVAIARALINKPSILFADEPTSALDDKNCDRVVHLLLDAASEAQATLIVATHDQRLKQKIKNQIQLV